MKALPLVIFDVEGTLVDCVQETLRCWRETFHHFGFEVSLEALHKQSGRDPDEMIGALIPAGEAERHADALKKEQGRRYRTQYLKQTAAFPDIRTLFEHIKQARCQTALATSCAEDELSFYLQRTGIRDLVDIIACGQDVEHEKPHPDIIELALERSGRPGKAVMIGDTPYDAQAANAAGIAAIGMLTGGFSPTELINAGCVEIFRDPSHLKAEMALLLESVGALQAPG